MKQERIYAPKVSTKRACKQAMVDMAKERKCNKINRYGSIQDSHVKMNPKSFASVLPLLSIVYINGNNSQYFKKSNK